MEESWKGQIANYFSWSKKHNVSVTFIPSSFSIFGELNFEEFKEYVVFRAFNFGRLHCLVGLKDVMKAVEKNQASIVLCERNPNPLMLTKLLVPLCRKKSIPLLALKNFTSTLTKLLKVPRCLTIALAVINLVLSAVSNSLTFSAHLDVVRYLLSNQTILCTKCTRNWKKCATHVGC